MVCTPASQLVDFMTARAHEVSKLAPPSSWTPSPYVKGQQVPSPSGPALKRPLHAHSTAKSVAPKEEEVSIQEAPFSIGPSEAITGPLGTSLLPVALQRGPAIPCCVPQLNTSCWILQVSQLEELQQNIHLQVVQKAYLQLGLYGVPLPSGAFRGPSSLSQVWNELKDKYFKIWQSFMF